MDIASSPNRFHDELSDQELSQILNEACDIAVSRAAQARYALELRIEKEFLAAQALVKTLYT